MHSLSLIRVVLVALELVEFLTSPLGIGAVAWLLFYTVLRCDSLLSPWTAALLPLIVITQWSTELKNHV